MKNITTAFLIASLTLSAGLASVKAQGFDHSHSAFTTILKSHVKNNKVDYAGLKKSPGALDSYLNTLAAVPESKFDTWDKDERMAFLINLYNATTLKLVVDHYPVKSIKNIGGVLKSPWKLKVVHVFGKKHSLDDIEHEQLRKKYKDARIHFAVNCASIGCPSLRAEAFQASQLSRQLDEQGRAFLADRTKNRIDASSKTLYLSQIFDWFKGDFKNQAGSVENFIATYASAADARQIKRGGFSVKYMDYDWNLNQQ
ncbi:DUF547 domain-containing protein [Verrucomicrobiaceae bacterium R5-34]|nr:DUF547 domain-containing protein [Verrucomicrobiaceae bacterium R5-34]